MITPKVGDKFVVDNHALEIISIIGDIFQARVNESEFYLEGSVKNFNRLFKDANGSIATEESWQKCLDIVAENRREKGLD